MVFLDRVNIVLAEKNQVAGQMNAIIRKSDNFPDTYHSRNQSPLGIIVTCAAIYLSTSADYLLGITDERHPIIIPKDGINFHPFEIFDERLKILLNDKNKSARQMIKDIGIGQRSTWNWQRRKTVPIGSTLIKLADYLNTSVDYLLGLTDEKRRGGRC